MYFGFDTGTGHFRETPETRALTCQRLEVSRWFKSCHHGDRQHNREGIRESI